MRRIDVRWKTLGGSLSIASAKASEPLTVFTLADDIINLLHHFDFSLAFHVVGI